jgi:hypothetical protein
MASQIYEMWELCMPSAKIYCSNLNKKNCSNLWWTTTMVQFGIGLDSSL